METFVNELAQDTASKVIVAIARFDFQDALGGIVSS